MDFQLSDEQLRLQATVRAFADKECAPLAAEWDRENRVPEHHFEERLIALGLYGLTLPEEYGGGGRELLDAILCIEQLARISPLCAAGVFESSVGPVRVIERFGTDAQKARWLPAVCRGETEISIGMSEPEAGARSPTCGRRPRRWRAATPSTGPRRGARAAGTAGRTSCTAA